MKKYFYILIIIISVAIIPLESFAFSFSNASAQYSAAARNRSRYYPQTYYSNRFMRHQNNYIYSPQQARYYGYRTYPQNSLYGNPYYNRYRR